MPASSKIAHTQNCCQETFIIKSFATEPSGEPQHRSWISGAASRSSRTRDWDCRKVTLDRNAEVSRRHSRRSDLAVRNTAGRSLAWSGGRTLNATTSPLDAGRHPNLQNRTPAIPYSVLRVSPRRYGAACVLEGLPQAIPGFMPHRPVSSRNPLSTRSMWRATGADGAGFARRYWLSPNSANAWPLQGRIDIVAF
jgi:hypothetical protein